MSADCCLNNAGISRHVITESSLGGGGFSAASFFFPESLEILLCPFLWSHDIVPLEVKVKEIQSRR